MEFLRKELLSIRPGIGPLTAASLLVEIGDVKRFATFYHLNSFVGLLLMDHSSGQVENKMSLTVRKHRQLRSDLVESAWTAGAQILQWLCIFRSR
jgi:transposase